MKKLSLTLAALALVAAPSLASAQTTSATVNAQADVVATLTATVTNTLYFGQLALGASSTLAPSTTGAQTLGNITGSTVGIGQVQVSHNTDVNVTATATDLTNSATSQTLTFSPACATAATSGGTGSSVTCASFALTGPGSSTPTNSYVLVGGTVTGDAAAGIGTFTGSITFNLQAVN